MLTAPFARALSAAAFVGALAFQPAALAIPIGDFSWTQHGEAECEVFCGPLFSVGNFSNEDFSLGDPGSSFFDVFVDLETDAGSSSLALGEIAAGGFSSQSIEDLFGSTISFAALRLTLPTLPGSVRLLDPDGNIVGGLTAPGSLLIDYDDSVSVPEPSTLLLLASGVIGVALGRKAGQRTPQTSRTKPSRQLTT